VVAIGLVIFAGAIELAQLFAPGRHARLSDFIVDASAACIGLAAALVFPTQSLVPRGASENPRGPQPGVCDFGRMRINPCPIWRLGRLGARRG
jgi:hypothetical protein